MSLRIWTALAASALSCFAQEWANPVIPGDHPDPSVVRVGEDYYATATSSGWAPIFPVFHSRDLRKWEQVGAIFERRPEWSVSNYWAPEITHYRGKFYVYYTARKRDGPLCVAVATAENPDDEWEDHGPLVCDPDGSIDAMAVDDENGRRYLIWKEDGNSQKRPTPIWAQPLTGDGLHLAGERKELIRNDAPWEGAVVEGPFILRRDGYFYLFYAGGACCGNACNYAEGVARSRRLLGPYEKNPNNPIRKAGGEWKCPGHGSLTVDARGQTWFLYHAYPARNSIYLGRESLLDEVTWNAQGWPEMKGPPDTAIAASPDFRDNFSTTKLRPGWQWPPDNQPQVRTDSGGLLLTPARNSPDRFTAALIARAPTTADYTATTTLDTASLRDRTTASLAAYGNAQNALGLAATGEGLLLWRRENGNESIADRVPLPVVPSIELRMIVADGHRFEFGWRIRGRNWNRIPLQLDGGYLPPWDMATRIALATSGPVRFEEFSISATTRDRAEHRRRGGVVRSAVEVIDGPAEQPARAEVAIAPAAQTPPAKPVARRPILNAEDFAAPAKRYRPWTVWWWFGNASNEQDLMRELAEMDSHGIGGVEINCIYPLDLPDPAKPDTVPMYSSAWQSRFDAVLREAERRGMKVWLRGGSGWPYGGPWIPRDLSARAVAAGILNVRGPQEFKLPKPNAPKNWTVDALERIVAVEKTTGERLMLEKPAVPAGEWRVYAVYRMFTNQTVKRAAPGGGGLVLDHFSTKAVDEQIRPLQALIPIMRYSRGAFAGITSDSLELDDSNWTTDFLKEFETRRGYDVSRWLPDLWTRFNDDSDGVRQDFLATLSELQVERYFRRLTGWAASNGFATSIQAHGGIADALDAYGSVPVPDGETIWPGQDQHLVNMRNRVLAASAAHIYGRPIVSAESYTWLRMPRFMVTLEMMKAASDAIYLDGINQIKNHGYSSSPEAAAKPGWVFYASTMVNHNQTWWPHYPAVAAYVTRMNYLMQAGDRVASVAIYSNIHDARASFDSPKKPNAAWDGQDDAWHRPQDPGLDTSARISMQVGECAEYLRRSGYGYDVVNDDAIRRGLSNYRALVFYRTKSVPPETMRALERFRRGGGLVFAVGQSPSEGVGLLRRDEQRIELARLRTGIATTGSLQGLRAALDKTVEPDFQSEPALSFIHRVSEGRHYYFVANPTERTVTARVWFHDALPGVEQWNAMGGTIGPARNPVTLGPWESTVFVFSENGPRVAPADPPRHVKELNLRWTVSFPDPVNQTYDWSRLQDWSELPELRSFSGIATYAADFEVPDEVRNVAIELGDVRSSAEVLVNGEWAGITFLPPYRVELGPLVQPGKNRIEVRVANLWSNYVRFLPHVPSKLAGPGYGLTDVLYGASDRPLLSSGLLGPVRLLWHGPAEGP